jgi:N-acetylglucosamine kinase-like BadF-type ATPase
VNSSEIAKVIQDCFSVDDLQQVKQVFFYGSGCGSVDSKAIVQLGISNSCKHAQIIVEHDLMAAAHACCGEEEGVACILGTGSNACVFDGTKIIAEGVSYGYVMGDEGSGNHLGRMLLKSVFSRKAPREILDAFYERYPRMELSLLLNQLYNIPNPNRFLASFSPFILSFQKHSFVKALIYRSFNEFVDEFLVDLLKEKSYTVSFQGSIAWSYRTILAEVLNDRNIVMGQVIRQPIDSLVEYHRMIHKIS